MARCLSVASGTAMSADTVRPTIVAWKWSAIVGARRIGTVVVEVTVVVVVVGSAVVATWIGGSEGRHHLLHLSKQRGFTSSHGGFTLLHSSIGNIVSGRNVGFRGRDNERVNNTLCDKVDHSLSGIGLMVDVASSGECAKVLMGIPEVDKHVGPGFVSGWFARPEAHVVMKDGLFHKERVSEIHLLLGGERGVGMFGEFL